MILGVIEKKRKDNKIAVQKLSDGEKFVEFFK